MESKLWRVHNPQGNRRVVVTKELPGRHWLDVLSRAGCRVEICTSSAVLSISDIAAAIGTRACRTRQHDRHATGPADKNAVLI